MIEGQNSFSQANSYVALENVRGTVSAKAVFVSKLAKGLSADAIHLVVLESKKAALFFCSDIYNFFEDDQIFLLPPSGKDSSNESLKGASAKVQRTAALQAIEEFSAKKVNENLGQCVDSCKSLEIDSALLDKKIGKGQILIISYPEAIQEKVLKKKTTADNVMTIEVGSRIGHEFLKEMLQGMSFF